MRVLIRLTEPLIVLRERRKAKALKLAELYILNLFPEFAA